QSVAVDFTVASDWGSGFVGQIELENTGSAAISSWQIEFDLGGQLVSLWNGQPSVAATHYAVRDLGWNGAIQPGASTVFGFQIASSGAVPPPANCRFKGVACSFAGGAPGPAPAPPPPSPTPTPIAMTVQWKVLGNWSTGYKAAIQISNGSSV